MPEIDPRNATLTWKYALAGGLASIPFTAVLYWQSNMGDEISLNMVIFGGLLAGFLAEVRQVDGKSVGFRAGVVGGLPILWVWFDILWAAIAATGPVWFQTVAVVTTIGIAVLCLAFSGGVGFVGAKIGRWLAEKTDTQRLPIAIN